MRLLLINNMDVMSCFPVCQGAKPVWQGRSDVRHFLGKQITFK